MGNWIGFRGNFTREKSILGATGGALDSEITPSIRNYGFSMIVGGSFQNQAHAVRFSGSGTLASLDPYLPQVLLPNASLLLNTTLPGDTQPKFVSAGSPLGGGRS